MDAMVLYRISGPLVRETRPIRCRARARSASGSKPVRCAAPTSTSSTASCRTSTCRSYPA